MNEVAKTASTARDLEAILRRYVEVEDETLALLAHELETVPVSRDDTREKSRQKILSEIELHGRADALVEEVVAKYREALYLLSRHLSEEDSEAEIITRAHVRHAQALLSRKPRRYSWADVLVAVGGIALGTALPHLLQLAERAPTQHANVPLLIAGVVGALLFGMGAVGKAIAR